MSAKNAFYLTIAVSAVTGTIVASLVLAGTSALAQRLKSGAP